MKKIVVMICVILLTCLCLSGCEYWQDEDGTHFMLFGERGAMKDGKPLTEEEAASLLEEDLPSQSSSTKDNLDSTLSSPSNDNIKGNFLKKGWTSDDNNLLKGINVSVAGDTELFSITAKEDKEAVFNFEAVLESGDYEIVLIFPDKSETVLYNTQSDTNTEKATLKEGANSIWIRCDGVVFKEIALSINGLDVSDF